jgi:glutamyl/glutaminyl-tRNA synthetase
MRNFLALLGWSPGNDDEILPLEAMIQRFTLEGLQARPAVFDTTKLEWMNGQYLSMLPGSELEAPVRERLRDMDIDPGATDLVAMIGVVKARARTVTMIAEMIAVRLPGASVTRDAKAQALADKLGDRFGGALSLAAATLGTVAPSEWNSESLESTL